MIPRFLRTTHQIVTNVWPVLFRLAPTYSLPDVSHINQDFLRREGIELVIWDVDGTLMAYHDTSLPPAFNKQLQDMVAEGTTQHAILSNCDESRFVELGRVFADLPVFRGYVSETGWITRIRRNLVDTHSDSEVETLLSTGARHVRKPDGRLVKSIMEEMGVTDPRRTLVVGDQYLTDVATAHLAGARSAKIRTWEKSSFPGTIRVTQRLEALIAPLLTQRRPKTAIR